MHPGILDEVGVVHKQTAFENQGFHGLIDGFLVGFELGLEVELSVLPANHLNKTFLTQGSRAFGMDDFAFFEENVGLSCCPLYAQSTGHPSHGDGLEQVGDLQNFEVAC